MSGEEYVKKPKYKWKAFLYVTDKFVRPMVVYATTYSGAKNVIYHKVDPEMPNYLHIRVRRVQKLDRYYRGNDFLNWDDPTDKRVLIKAGFECIPRDGECEHCALAEECGGKYEGKDPYWLKDLSQDASNRGIDGCDVPVGWAKLGRHRYKIGSEAYYRHLAMGEKDEDDLK